MPLSSLLMPQDVAARLSSSVELQPGLRHVTVVSPRAPAAGWTSVAAGTEQTGWAAAELCRLGVSICGGAGFSAGRAATPEQVVASPLGGERGVGGAWILLILSDLSCLQPGLGFPPRDY